MTDKKSQKQKTYGRFIFVLLAAAVAGLTIFDQLMKYAAVVMLKGRPPFVLIDSVLELRYLENQGAAFGMLQNRQLFFTIITLVFIAISVYAVVKIPKNRYYLPLMLAVCLLFSGALGNFIDSFWADDSEETVVLSGTSDKDGLFEMDVTLDKTQAHGCIVITVNCIVDGEVVASCKSKYKVSGGGPHYDYEFREYY